MKTYIKSISLVVLLGIVLVSCDTYLEEEPRDLVSPSNFFNTSSEFELAVVGLYDIFKQNSLHGKVGLDRYYENGADVIGPNRVFGQVEPIQSYSLSESNISAIDQGGGAPLTWQDLYGIILNANTILQQLDINENISQEERNLFEAETFFLRAYAYYHLTNLWGDVPYYRDALSIDEIQTLPRTDKNQIRNEILEDLQQAQNVLPATYEPNKLSRASKWAAATVMVKIYLIQQKWQEARDKAVEIITDSPHNLLDDYAAVFDLNNEYNEENIWELDFAKDVNSNDWVDHFTPRIRDEPKDQDKRPDLSAALAERNEGFTGYGLAIPLPDYVNKFPMDDLRRPMNLSLIHISE